MLMIRDTKPTNPIPGAAKKAGEAAAEVAKDVAMAGDDYQVKRKVTPEQVQDAFDRLAKAESRARGLSVGTLGMLPAYEKALAEVTAAKEEIAGLRKAAPDLVAAEEARRGKAAQETLESLVIRVAKGAWQIVDFAFRPVGLAIAKAFGKD